MTDLALQEWFGWTWNLHAPFKFIDISVNPIQCHSAQKTFRSCCLNL